MKKTCLTFGGAMVLVLALLAGCVPSSTSVVTGNVEIDLTGFNDFHAAISEKDDDVGLAKFAALLKKRKSEGSIIVNSGDMWKGEFPDSYTHGGLVSKCFANVGVDVTTIGNHEFDWGAEWITKNEGPDYLNDKMLGANIYEYPEGPHGWVKSDLGAPYKVIVKNEGQPNEVRVGFIGVIGVNQITSITSTAAWNYIFRSTADAIKENSTILRKEKKCDIVIASYHNGGYDSSVLDIDPKTGKRYVDGIFLGHTHKLMRGMKEGVPYLQSACFGHYVGEMAFNVDLATRAVECIRYENVPVNGNELASDPEVQALIDEVEKGEEGTDKITGEHLGTATGSMGKGTMASYFATKCAEKVSETRDIDICIFNGARESVRAGDVTYGDLFYSNPFENELYIIDVSGSDVFYQTNNGCFYRVRDEAFVDSPEARYKALVYNYNGLHINVSGDEKYYDYFASLDDPNAEAPVRIEDLPGLRMNAVDIAAWYMRNGDNVLDPADYGAANIRYDRYRLDTPIA